jgi:hypothetical protein
MLGPMNGRQVLSQWLLVVLGGICLLGCEEEKAEKSPVASAPPEVPEPVVESPPHLVVSEDGPTVRGTSIEGGKKSGTLPHAERGKLKTYLEAERKFIEGQDLTLVIDRKAKRGWVSAYLHELGELGAGKITVATETREEFNGKLEFLPPQKGAALDGCTMIGQVTKHNGSALWQVKGGTASERGPGLGGPDLSMAKEVIEKNYKTCESSTFITDGENDKDWGFIFDMAAAAASIKDLGVVRGMLPEEPQTAGRAAKL